MKIKVFPPPHPDQVNMDYMVDVQFNDRVEQFNVIASYKPDVTNPLNGIRVGISAEFMGASLPLDINQEQIIQMLEGQATVWTPSMLQYWPQYAEQPTDIRRMPQYALILQKIKVDAVMAFMSFMADKQEFHVFLSSKPQDDQLDLAALPQIIAPSGNSFLSRVHWADHLKKVLMLETIHADTLETENNEITMFGLEPLCQTADLIQYWVKTITKSN